MTQYVYLKMGSREEIDANGDRDHESLKSRHAVDLISAWLGFCDGAQAREERIGKKRG